MIPKATSPLAEAMELWSSAVRAHLDGPCAFAQQAATRMTQPDYDEQVAARDASGYAVRAAQAWWAGAFAAFDAMAILADPPAVVHHFVVPIPPLPETCTATVGKPTWTWALGDPPPNVVITLLPVTQFPTTVKAGTTKLEFRATPFVLEPSWQVDVLFTPVSGANPFTQACPLDLTTEVF